MINYGKQLRRAERNLGFVAPSIASDDGSAVLDTPTAPSNRSLPRQGGVPEPIAINGVMG